MSKTVSFRDDSGHISELLKTIVILVAIATLVIVVKLVDLEQVFRETLAWISDLGPLGPLILIGILIMACVLMLPETILTLGAGFVFGVVKGSIAVSIGSTLGATCAFLIGRYLVRDWISRKISGNEKFKAVDEAAAREGWKIVLLTRLSPIFPFNLLNYAFGLTNISLKHYFLASWIGMIPGTIMYVYIGSLACNLAKMRPGQHTRTTGEWVLYGVGLLATLIVMVLVTRIAKKALANRIPSEEGK
ncbi:MAG TPA: TVP38/TMEM64 family protein [Phycisphaerales bacterium]|nr:TVP38/TMEM64 family protein [Phycisphaerales bacterium]